MKVFLVLLLLAGCGSDNSYKQPPYQPPPVVVDPDPEPSE
jgi:hypothetical protein